MGSLVSKPKAPAPPPPPQDPAPMPDPQITGAAKKRQYQEMRARSGRQSTMLTDRSTDKLGG